MGAGAKRPAGGARAGQGSGESVGGGQTLRRLNAVVDRLAQRHGRGAHALAQGLAFQQFGDEIPRALEFADIDVAVRQFKMSQQINNGQAEALLRGGGICNSALNCRQYPCIPKLPPSLRATNE